MTQKLIPSKRITEVEGMEIVIVLRMYKQRCWNKNNDPIHVKYLIVFTFITIKYFQNC